MARGRGATICQLGVDFDVGYRPPHALDSAAAAGQIDFQLRHADGVERRENLELALLGRHQAANAAVALAAIAELRRQGWRIPEGAIRRGLAQVRCPARIEIVSRRPTIVIDTAHNPASARSLTETLAESFTARRRLLLFAATLDKQVREMLESLLPAFDHVILTRYRTNPRGVPLEELTALAATISAAGLSSGAVRTRHAGGRLAARLRTHHARASGLRDGLVFSGSRNPRRNSGAAAAARTRQLSRSDWVNACSRRKSWSCRRCKSAIYGSAQGSNSGIDREAAGAAVSFTDAVAEAVDAATG